jgi:hypothetical protein
MRCQTEEADLKKEDDIISWWKEADPGPSLYLHKAWEEDRNW